MNLKSSYGILVFMLLNILIVTNVFGSNDKPNPQSKIEYNLNSQLKKEPVLKKVVVGSDFNQFSMESESLKILFRKDRLEFIDLSNDESLFFFLKFNDVKNMIPEGVGLMDEISEDISGTPIASVLNVNEKETFFYEQISLVIDGQYEMVFSINEDELIFEVPADFDLGFTLINNIENPKDLKKDGTLVQLGENKININSLDYSYNMTKREWTRLTKSKTSVFSVKFGSITNVDENEK